MTRPIDIDAIGLLCPLPVLRLRKVLEGLAPGQTVRLLASDKMAEIDVPHFCAEQGHSLIARDDIPEGTAFLVRKG